MLKGKKIILGVSGSIAAYKAALLVRLFIKAGAEVKVVMTTAAAEFITPLTLSTLSKNDVHVSLATDNSWNNHVALGRWADLMLIAPASCNTLSKMANGACDNLLMAVYLSAVCPVVVVPAMDEDMWKHPATKSNLQRITSFGNHIIPVNNGELASGLVGEGRMAEPEAIVDWIDHFLSAAKDLSGKKVLITAGPTHEAIDPVRFIANHSSGKMGLALANECVNRGSEVTLVMGPGTVVPPPNLDYIKVVSAEEMYQACLTAFPGTDIAIMCAAVADYTPVEIASEKIKKTEANFSIALKRTTDILKKLGELKKTGQLLVGFALETNNEKEFALRKLASKNADFIVLNSMNDAGAGFGHDTNKITIFDKAGGEHAFETKSKQAAAADIINIIINTHA